MKFSTTIFSSVFPLFHSKTAKDTYIVTSGNIIFSISASLFTILLFRTLTVSDFGIFSVLLAFILILADLAEFGIGSSLSSFLPRMRSDTTTMGEFLGSAFLVQVIIGIVISLLIFLFSSDIADILLHTTEYQYLIQVCSLGIIAAIITNFSQYALSAQQKFFPNSILTILAGLLRVIFILILIFFKSTSLSFILQMQVITLCILASVGCIFLVLNGLRIVMKKSYVQKLLSFSWYLGITKGATSLSGRLDILMLVMLSNATEVGFYSTALRVASVFSILSGSIITVIAPKFASLSSYVQMKKYLMKVAVIITGIIISILIFILVSHPFMTIVFGNKALPSVWVLQLLLISIIFSIATIPLTTLTTYYFQKPHAVTIINIVQLFIIFTANILFIPLYGRIGTAYSLILAYGCTFLLSSYTTYVYLGKKFK